MSGVVTYELAKELSDAGFPYPYKFGKDYKLAPTLSELIEACGERFYSLTVIDDQRGKWAAFDNHVVKEGWGPTPEEAVARLWLALNKKL